jgi:hypothetical protein
MTIEKLQELANAANYPAQKEVLEWAVNKIESLRSINSDLYNRVCKLQREKEELKEGKLEIMPIEIKIKE